MKRIIHTIAEAAAFMYCVTVLMVVYATGAVAMYDTPIPSWYGTALTIVVSVPVLIGITFAAVKIAKAINYRTPGKRLGTINRDTICRVMEGR